MKSLEKKNSKRTAQGCLAIAFVFLLAQILETVHAAEHGSDPHEHGGVPCVVQFLSQTAKALDAPLSVIVDSPFHFDAAKHFQTVAFWHPQFLTNRHCIRGPPFPALKPAP
jgi:hypothetical protein